MRKLFHIILLTLLAVACRKENPEGGEIVPDGPVTPGIIEAELVKYDKSFDLTIPEKVCWQRKDEQVVIPQAACNGLIDLHMEVLPIYVFGAQAAASGDYYAVKGYLVVHNAAVFADDKITARNAAKDQLRRCGWYMSDMHSVFQLLDDKGNTVNYNNVSFFVTPEPSTTIGSTTYNKGFTFTLPVMATIGGAKYADPSKGETEPSWKRFVMGILCPTFEWEDSSTQNLPDQSVNMSTDPYSRAVSYSLLTNNLRKEMGASAIPGVARSDQRFDFSFVWHVHGGSYYAKDGDFGHMKLRVSLNPKWKTNIEGDVSYQSPGSEFPGMDHLSSYDDISTAVTAEQTFDLPAINRIPAGYFRMKNTSRRYLCNITLWREGEYGKEGCSAYNTVKGSYDTNESFKSLTRAGRYDLVYELKDGDTGESHGKFIIRGFEVKENATADIATLDGTRL